MGLFDNMSEKELKKMKEADFITRKLSSAGNVSTSELFETIDKETGVRYIFCSRAGYAGGFTPRLNLDGTLMKADMSELNNL